ncbi:beta-1:4-N-acetylgalactosaminyltransferase bre-4-like isoform X1 [Dinothrombium tinctorium]|uniref:Beta-1,4-N-acetylgalactosaminyltransferase n=2 Tax=Dinothrombium tinctorium TaxID=1965070 RepID=A0A3S3RSJ4_9ACAR|nr:beta-1:4-N-acetylgalactosaminyltransferase bre-4-like isoform X1 [Dinothrombium tinctorium]RWS06439.1 beta-1:4-N-acetylgalactosaminyltransferase bre-4-like isoform X1 [Dinothrombium tinctorium]
MPPPLANAIAINSQSHLNSNFCRMHGYKVLAAIIVLFLFMQYITNFVEYNGKFTQTSPRFSLTSFNSIDVDKRNGFKAYLNSTNSAFQFQNSTIPSSSLCPLVPPKLVGRLRVMDECPTFEELEAMNPQLLPGGRYFPTDCTARQKVAVIIPYRNRERHLRIFLHNIHPFLMRQQLDYGIYVVEQIGDSKFNRAKLFNIGFVEILKQYDFTCFIFHDVDLIPEDDRNLYKCADQPRHLSVSINTMKYKLPYTTLFGGVSALTKEQMEAVNGFSNVYWGWGGEDDDMSHRIRAKGFRISRYPANIARYTMLSHKKDVPSPERYKKLYSARARFKTDGLSNLNYKVEDIKFKKLYTWILVDPLAPKR